MNEKVRQKAKALQAKIIQVGDAELAEMYDDFIDAVIESVVSIEKRLEILKAQYIELEKITKT